MSELVAGSSLKEMFRSLLREACSGRTVALGEGTELYLVNLLSEFVAIDKLFPEEEEGRRAEEPLAFLYHRAQQQARGERIHTLRRLGDVSLYKAGFFRDNLENTVVGPDYYIQMGGTAYGEVASLANRAGFSAVYRELCDKFRDVVELLETIAARHLAASGPSGVMKVYESWVRSGSDRLEKVLIDSGVLLSRDPLPN